MPLGRGRVRPHPLRSSLRPPRSQRFFPLCLCDHGVFAVQFSSLFSCHGHCRCYCYFPQPQASSPKPQASRIPRTRRTPRTTNPFHFLIFPPYDNAAAISLRYRYRSAGCGVENCTPPQQCSRRGKP